MSRRPEVTITAFHALDPRDCTCADDACVAAAIERTSALDGPGVVRCDEAAVEAWRQAAIELLRGPDDLEVAAARRGGAR